MAFFKDLTFDDVLVVADESAGTGMVLGGDPLARVHVVSNEFEAQVLMDVLQHEGIDAVLQSYRELAFDGLFIPQRGWGCILTREQDSVRALEAIQAALAAIAAAPADKPVKE